MTDADDAAESKRELVTKLLPHLALSAIGIGLFSSPVRLLSAAVEKYNEATQETTKKVNDLLPLLPWMEKLELKVEGPRTVSLLMRKDDIGSGLEQYLTKKFGREGAEGALFGPPPGLRERAELDYALRLPMRSVYTKMVGTLTPEKKAHLLEVAKDLNPSEVWLLAHDGERVDELMEPVFVGENTVLRGRLKSVTTGEMLTELFGKEFDVSVEPKGDDSVRVVLRLKG